MCEENVPLEHVHRQNIGAVSESCVHEPREREHPSHE
jgi:hypothetical protein